MREFLLHPLQHIMGNPPAYPPFCRVPHPMLASERAHIDGTVYRDRDTARTLDTRSGGTCHDPDMPRIISPGWSATR
jgi:hypothetical protein